MFVWDNHIKRCRAKEYRKSYRGSASNQNLTSRLYRVRQTLGTYSPRFMGRRAPHTREASSSLRCTYRRTTLWSHRRSCSGLRSIIRILTNSAEFVWTYSSQMRGAQSCRSGHFCCLSRCLCPLQTQMIRLMSRSLKFTRLILRLR